MTEFDTPLELPRTRSLTTMKLSGLDIVAACGLGIALRQAKVAEWILSTVSDGVRAYPWVVGAAISLSLSPVIVGAFLSNIVFTRRVRRMSPRWKRRMTFIFTGFGYVVASSLLGQWGATLYKQSEPYAQVRAAGASTEGMHVAVVVEGPIRPGQQDIDPAAASAVELSTKRGALLSGYREARVQGLNPADIRVDIRSTSRVVNASGRNFIVVRLHEDFEDRAGRRWYNQVVRIVGVAGQSLQSVACWRLGLKEIEIWRGSCADQIARTFGVNLAAEGAGS